MGSRCASPPHCTWCKCSTATGATPSVRPTLLGVLILVSFCRLALTENLCVSWHCHTLLPITCAHDFLSLWSSSPASQCRSDRALNLAVGGLASVELSCSLTTLVLQARLAPIPRLPILAVWSFHALFLFHSSSSVVGSRSATSYLATTLLFARGWASLHPATELRSARGRALTCSGPCCESSSGPSVITFALVESLKFSAQP